MHPLVQFAKEEAERLGMGPKVVQNADTQGHEDSYTWLRLGKGDIEMYDHGTWLSAKYAESGKHADSTLVEFEPTEDSIREQLNRILS